MFKCAIIQSMSDCSIKEDLIKIKELKLISKIENSPLLVLLGYYPEDDLSGAGNIVKGGWERNILCFWIWLQGLPGGIQFTFHRVFCWKKKGEPFISPAFYLIQMVKLF